MNCKEYLKFQKVTIKPIFGDYNITSETGRFILLGVEYKRKKNVNLEFWASGYVCKMYFKSLFIHTVFILKKVLKYENDDEVTT